MKKILLSLFLTGFTLGAIAQNGLCFKPQVNINTGAFLPSYITSADFNGDSLPDLAQTDEQGYHINVLMNTGAGTYTAAPAVYNCPNNSYPSVIVPADFTGDGKPDMMVGFSGPFHIAMYTNTGTGTFTASPSVPVTYGNAMAAGDFDGNGTQDLAVGSNSISIFLNSGGGTFGAATIYSVSVNNTMLTGDFNADGKLDLAAISGNNVDSVAVLLNTGSGSFTIQKYYGGPSQVFDLTSGDFNGDGKLDLATSNYVNNTASVLINSGTGTFTTVATYSVGTQARGITSADFNMDGKADIAVANSNSSNISVLLNAGGGLMAPAVNFTATAGGNNLISTDLDTNGLPDLAIAHISILYNISAKVAVSALATICAGGTATLTASGVSTYTWVAGPNTNTNTVSPTINTTYTVIGTNSDGCSDTTMVTVAINPSPTVTVNSATVCVGTTATLTASGATTYIWSTSATTASITATPTVTTNYTVTGTDANGCTNSTFDTVTVNALVTPTITITEFVPFAPFVNVATGGTATANNHYNGNDAMYAFDGDTVINGWGSASGGLPAWLAYDFGTGNNKIINEYSIFCSSQMTGGWGSSGYDPQTWTFEGFNGTTWVILDARTDNNPVQDIWKNYRFTNAIAYQMYRINISNTQDGSYAMVTELRMGLSNTTSHACGNQLFTAANDTSQKPFTYQWQLNGSNIGNGKDSLTLASFYQNDMLVCVLNTTAACATTNTLTSNTLTINHGPVNAIASVSSTTLTTAAVAGATYQWVNCNTGKLAIAGATNQSYVAAANGSYAVIVTANGCADTSACASVTTVGIDNFNAASSSVTIYPNPNNGNFVVTTTESAKTILVTDILGNELFSVTPNNNTTTISLNTQANGIYFVKIISDNAQTVKRIVINN